MIIFSHYAALQIIFGYARSEDEAQQNPKFEWLHA
jgi:hypothetical protein